MGDRKIGNKVLLQLAAMKMPFGKYSGRLLIDLPEPYVVWFARRGFPQGKLGEMLALVHEIKVNGLEYLIEPLRPGREAGKKEPGDRG
ncbi:MAG: DUF3820 family protein [Desulforhopalus sp.]